MTNNVQKHATSSSSIDNYDSVNYLYRNEQVFEILLSHIRVSSPLFFPFFFLLLLNYVKCKTFKKQEPALDRYHYRRAINLKLFGVVVKIIVLLVYILME